MGASFNGGLRLDSLLVYLQTKDPYYNPGSIVTGAVYLDVFRPVTIYNAELRIRGTERVKWEELKTNPQGDANKITEKMKDKQQIFDVSTLLQVGTASLPPGQYQYPFSFQLPDQIPGTFEIKHFDHDGRIRYSLIVSLNCGGLAQPIKYRTELIVRQRPTIPNYNAPVTSDEEVCVCFSNKGRCSMTCNFQSDTYQPGNDAMLMTTVDNKICTADIRNFTVGLIQYVNFRTRTGKVSDFTRTIRTKEFPGIQKNTSNQGNPQLMSIKLEESSFESGKLIQPSVDGTMIKCRYELKVVPVFDVPCSCCSRTPVITVPLYIYAPELQNWIPAIPPGFKPKVFETCNIIVPLSSMRLDINVSGGNIPMPFISGQITETSSLPRPNLSANVSTPPARVSTNIGGISMNISGNVDGPNLSVGTGHVRMNVSEDVKLGDPNVNIEVSGPGMSMRVSGPELEMSGPNVKVGIGGPNLHFDPSHSSLSMQVNAGNEMGGGHVNMGIPGGNVSVEVSGDANFGAGHANFGGGGAQVNMAVPGAEFTMKADF